MKYLGILLLLSGCTGAHDILLEVKSERHQCETRCYPNTVGYIDNG